MNKKIKRISREDGSESECTLDEAIKKLSGYWINNNNQIKKMLLAETRLWTPFFFYELKK